LGKTERWSRLRFPSSSRYQRGGSIENDASSRHFANANFPIATIRRNTEAQRFETRAISATSGKNRFSVSFG
jgi:hypothetical protein